MGRDDTNWYEPWDIEKWFADEALSRTHIRTRGCWAEWLWRMWQKDTYLLTGQLADFARMARTTKAQAAAALADIQRCDVAEVGLIPTSAVCVTGVTFHNAEITLISRKRRREYDARKSNADRQKRYRNNKTQEHKPGALRSRYRHRIEENKRERNASVTGADTPWLFKCRACGSEKQQIPNGEIVLCPKCQERMDKCSPV